MASMISLGVSFLLFFIVTGFMWLVGVNVLSQLFTSLPIITDSGWGQTFNELEREIKIIMLWAPGILVLFAAIKMLVNAGNRGAD